MDPADWRKKHAEHAKKTKKSSLPDMGTYNPIPVSFGTFQKLEAISKDKEKSGSKVKTWGTQERFGKKGKKTDEGGPGPGKYNTIAIWNGKPLDGKKSEKKDTNWMNKISKGIEKSIYYS